MIRSSFVTSLSFPPWFLGSRNVPSPTWVRIPGCPAAAALTRLVMTPIGKLYASISFLSAMSAKRGDCPQCPPITLFTNPFWASGDIPLSALSPSPVECQKVKYLGRDVFLYRSASASIRTLASVIPPPAPQKATTSLSFTYNAASSAEILGTKPTYAILTPSP